MNDFCSGDYPCGLSCRGVGRQDRQLNTYDYMADVAAAPTENDLVEVQFKHTRKGYFRNENRLDLAKGDMVVLNNGMTITMGETTVTYRS